MARFKQTDVSNAEQVQALVDFAVAEFGGLNIMFNNAGVSGAMHERYPRRRAAGLPARHGRQRARRHARHAARRPAHGEAGGGSIINTASIAGFQAGLGVMTYRASKAAVIHFTKSAAIDLAAYGIRVNCIAPGNIRTPMSSFDASMSEETAQRLHKALDAGSNGGATAQALRPARRRRACGRCTSASDRSSQVTGMLLPVDGGITAGDPVNHLQEILKARAEVLDS